MTTIKLKVFNTYTSWDYRWMRITYTKEYFDDLKEFGGWDSFLRNVMSKEQIRKLKRLGYIENYQMPKIEFYDMQGNKLDLDKDL